MATCNFEMQGCSCLAGVQILVCYNMHGKFVKDCHVRLQSFDLQTSSDLSFMDEVNDKALRV